MLRLIRKMIQAKPSRRLLILLEIVLAAFLVFCIYLYAHWDTVFGKDQWTVTQYGPRDINSSFYTIYNPKRGLIVVDGGWTEDASYVLDTLRHLGGKVDTWILTHPHQDHAGAFIALWNNQKDIRIGDVYTVDMASPEDCLAVAPWDSVDTYRDFLALDIPNLHYVHTGDHLKLCSLSFDCLSAFDDAVRERSKDYLNDGSMMFKVTGPEKSFLFCADVGKSMSKYLYKKYKKTLKSDYLQMGHHGYGGLKEKFYTCVAPAAAFFDAPGRMMEDAEGIYGTPAKVALMEGLGAQVFSFTTAPNAVTL